MDKPVILLAFANETPDDDQYLRNLRIELNQLKKVLRKAEDVGLCEVEIITNATLDEIFEAFLDSRFRNRIAVFHFAGHATSYKLLLETKIGEAKFAHAEGLVPFIASQKSLQLVFLNGCYSFQQGQALRKYGVPAVIGTVQEIDDNLAANLAEQFYKGLAEGLTIEYAWKTSTLKTQSEIGTEDLSKYFSQNQINSRGLVVNALRNQFPWELKYKPGKEEVRNWNLPTAAQNPYFGLPEPNTEHPLPDHPYRFLSRYQEMDYPIFFGRGQEIRSLYTRLSSPFSSPIVFLFGQSGVGKSSLLDAGLLPRLNVENEVHYIRRNQKVGLLGQLTQILDGDLVTVDTPLIDETKTFEPLEEDINQLEDALAGLEGNTKEQLQQFINQLKKQKEKTKSNTSIVLNNLHLKWIEKEKRSTKKRLIIIIDQIEEVFTRPNEDLSNELGDFFHQLHLIFNDPENPPKGKILLSYRKEFDSEITEEAQKNNLPKEKVFLNKLNKKAILEIVNGLNSNERLRFRYNLKIETGLANIIANNLMLDKGSPLAPVLQIILTKLWLNIKDNPNPTFTIGSYIKLYEKGILLSDFFDQQMKVIKEWENEIGQNVEKSGLALDILEHHTTSYGTSASQPIEQLRMLYQHRSDVLNQLIEKFLELYLLTKSGDNSTRLAHDTLAPIVKAESKISDRPGQIAKRILEAKMIDYEVDATQTIIEESSLKLVEQGEAGMRIWLPKEKTLIEKSRRQRRKNQLFRNGAIISALLLMLSLGLAWWQREKIRKNDLVTELINQANFEESNGQPKLAFETINKAIAVKPNDRGALQIRHDILSNNELHYDNLKMNHSVDRLIFIDEFDQYLTHNGSSIQLYSSEGLLIQSFSLDERVSAMAFCHRKNIVAGGAQNGEVVMWNLEGQRIATSKVSFEDWVNDLVFTEDGNQLFAAGRDGFIMVFDVSGEVIREFPKQEASINAIDLSSDDQYLIAGLENNNAIYFEVATVEERVFEGHKDRILDVALHEAADLIATASRDETIKLWNSKGDLLATLNDHEKRVNSIEFTPDGKYLISSSDDLTIKLWDLNTQKVTKTYRSHQDYVSSISLSKDGLRFISGGGDSLVYFWIRESKTLKKFGPFPNEISGAVFGNRNSDLFLTSGSLKATGYESILNHNWISKWNFNGEGNLVDSLEGHLDAINTIRWSPNKEFFGTASKDATAIIWTNEGEIVTALNGHVGPVNDLDFSADNEYVVTGGDDGDVLLWDFSGAPIDTLKGHQSYVTAVRFSKDAQYIYSTSFDNFLVVWSINGDSIHQIKPHDGRIIDMDIASNGNFLLTAGWDNIVKLWKIRGTTFDLVSEFTINQGNDTGFKGMNCVVFSPDNQFFAIGSEGGVARIYNMEGQAIQSFTDGGRSGVYALSFSPDSKYLFVGYGDGWGRMYENISMKNQTQ